MRRWLGLVAIVAVCVAGLAGCNTVEGMGEDIEATGQWIQEAADGEGE